MPDYADPEYRTVPPLCDELFLPLRLLCAHLIPDGPAENQTDNLSTTEDIVIISDIVSTETQRQRRAGSAAEPRTDTK